MNTDNNESQKAPTSTTPPSSPKDKKSSKPSTRKKKELTRQIAEIPPEDFYHPAGPFDRIAGLDEQAEFYENLRKSGPAGEAKRDAAIRAWMLKNSPETMPKPSEQPSGGMKPW